MNKKINLKKFIKTMFLLLILNISAVSCTTKETISKTGEGEEPTLGAITIPTEYPDPTNIPVESIPTQVETETVKATEIPSPEATSMTLSAENFDPTAEISLEIPEKYTTIRSDYCGSIEQITYPTYDYFGDKSEITKLANVYLPFGYDETKNYNVLYLMHGIGGNEKEWGMYTNASIVKGIMDNLIYYGDIEPFIVVTPNGRSSKNYADTSSDYNSFYLFGQELRDDLMPYIEANYATYANYKEEGYDLTVDREHRAMAGLSMGGMQTINIGLCESLDMISYFGAFSACPTTNTSKKIVETLKNNETYNINYLYNICGTADDIAWSSATSSVDSITSLTNKLEEGRNYMWQEVEGGGHDFKVWYLGFYNFAQLVFKNQ